MPDTTKFSGGAIGVGVRCPLQREPAETLDQSRHTHHQNDTADDAPGGNRK